jgi:hypothetical protein
MQYGPGIDEDVSKSTFAPGDLFPKTVLVAPNVPTDDLVRMHHFWRITRRGHIVWA